jgi:hypothetical protein
LAKKVLDKITIGEISAVDFPAQVGARAVIMKRDSSGDLKKGQALLTSVKGHSHILADENFDGAPINAGDTSFATSKGATRGHSHPWIRDDEGNITIGESDGHTHEIEAFARKRASQGDDTMTDAEIKKAQDDAVAEAIRLAKVESDAAAEKSTAELAKVQDRLDEVTAKAALSASDQKRFDGMSPEDRKTFLAGKKEKRASMLAKIAAAESDANPVIYKAAGGTEYRKDQGALAALAKTADEQADDLAKMRTETADLLIEKRVTAELGGLPNAIAAGHLLKAADGIEDEAVRKDAQKLLKSASEAIAMLGEGNGHGGGEGNELAKAGRDFDAKVAEIRKRDDCTHVQAMQKARTEHPDLLKAMREQEQTSEAA